MSQNKCGFDNLLDSGSGWMCLWIVVLCGEDCGCVCVIVVVCWWIVVVCVCDCGCMCVIVVVCWWIVVVG